MRDFLVDDFTIAVITDWCNTIRCNWTLLVCHLQSMLYSWQCSTSSI